MFRVQRNDSKNREVLVQDDDLVGRLHDLYREQSHRMQPWPGPRQTASGRIVDRAHVQILLSLFLGPRLERNGLLSNLSRREDGLRFGSGNSGLISRHLKVPRTTTSAAALVDARQVGFPIGGAGNRRSRLIL